MHIESTSPPIVASISGARFQTLIDSRVHLLGVNPTDAKSPEVVARRKEISLG
jgi:hypothetical protein